MKLIDEKGKIFGAVNIIDLIILLLILLVAAGAYYKFSHRAIQGKTATVEFQVMVPFLRPEMAQAIKVGDKMVEGSSYTDVTVKDVQIKPGFAINTDSRGQRVESTDPYLVDVYVTNTGKASLSSATITMGGQVIRIGKDYYVKSRDYEFKGTITGIKVEDNN